MEILILVYLVICGIFAIGLARMFLKDTSDWFMEIIGIILAILVSTLWPLLVLAWTSRLVFASFGIYKKQ